MRFLFDFFCIFDKSNCQRFEPHRGGLYERLAHTHNVNVHRIHSDATSALSQWQATAHLLSCSFSSDPTHRQNHRRTIDWLKLTLTFTNARKTEANCAQPQGDAADAFKTDLAVMQQKQATILQNFTNDKIE